MANDNLLQGTVLKLVGAPVILTKTAQWCFEAEII